MSARLVPRDASFAEVRDLFLNLARAELTARYKTTTLGMLWFVLNPLLMTLIFTIVFGHVVRLEIERYPMFVLSGLLPWAFFQTGLVNATGSFVRSVALIKRVQMPRVLIPLAAIAASLAHFVVSLVVLLIVMVALGVPLSPQMAFLPGAVLLATACVTGLGLATASVNVLFRDVEHILTAVLRALFYLTPTFYPLSYVPERWQPLFLLNPAAGLVEIHRALLLDGALPEARVVGATVVATGIVLAAGLVLFRYLEADFDDHV
ncbi:MAG TPA: ABC transporter permease [Candidatus Acidoferrum sp.]|nr:ABC transporter permease [Candidatus Acidoferrum sp.]